MGTWHDVDTIEVPADGRALRRVWRGVWRVDERQRYVLQLEDVHAEPTAADDGLPVVLSTVAVRFPVLDPDDPQAEGVLSAWYVDNAETVALGQPVGEVYVDDTCGIV